MSVCTAIRTLFVDPDWFATAPVNHRAYILGHEMTHVALEHCEWIARKVPEDRYIANVAADLATFSILSHTDLERLRGDVSICTPADFYLPLDLTVDQYFSALKAQQEKQEKEKQEEQDDEGDDDETGTDEDSDNTGDGDDETQQDDVDGDEGAEETDDTRPASGDDDGDEDSVSDSGRSGSDDLDDGADPGTGDVSAGDDDEGRSSGGDGTGESDSDAGPDAERDAGKPSGPGLTDCDDLIPNNTTEAITGQQSLDNEQLAYAVKASGCGLNFIAEILTARKIQRISWTSVVSQFLTVLAPSDDYSFSRLSRRSLWRRVGIPGKCDVETLPCFATLLDVSGSITDEMLAKAAATLSEIACEVCGPDMLCHLVQFSDGVTDVKQYTYADMPFRSITAVGRGSTFVASAFERLKALKPNPLLVLVLTDGEIFDLGTVKNPRIPVLWLITGGYGNFKPPFGRSVPVY